MEENNFGKLKMGEIVKSITGELFVVWDYSEKKGSFALISYNEIKKMKIFMKEYLEDNCRWCSMADFLRNYKETDARVTIENIYRFRE
ncbi:hypothetical protein [Anaeromicropila herbilytica]|uniref:Uncharacterized protein n=1 Tax=Anaeromicropila herbilytica TaxID=2785025 RepID=A0A7R7EKL2_9FIRM|nr:hypothetical protein [Anaeromicropila herbilytica]BCN30492.1 hypothetical protein bsdtb5_17870 [Anaeromicropila herbilytica]